MFVHITPKFCRANDLAAGAIVCRAVVTITTLEKRADSPASVRHASRLRKLLDALPIDELETAVCEAERLSPHQE